MIDRLIGEADFEHILKSWIFLENHDTAAAGHDRARPRALAGWPRCCSSRCPGRPTCTTAARSAWPAETIRRCGPRCAGTSSREDNPTLAWTRRLIDLHQSHRALRVGQFRTLTTDRLIGYERHTDRIADSVFVLANPSRRRGDRVGPAAELEADEPVLDAGPARRCRRAADERDAPRHPAGRRVPRAGTGDPPRGRLLVVQAGAGSAAGAVPGQPVRSAAGAGAAR